MYENLLQKVHFLVEPAEDDILGGKKGLFNQECGRWEEDLLMS